MSAIGIPVFNEEANLADLLDFLVDEPGVDEIVAVDDCSTDGSLEILNGFAKRYGKVRVKKAPERSGQLAAWRAAAESSNADSICFIDADAIPARNACKLLLEALDGDARLAVVSGRTVPDCNSRVWAAARFRAELVHRLRALQLARHTIMGRFFAVRREWFLTTALRSDIIANDAYLGGVAQRTGRGSRYIAEALCYYGEAQTTFDFAAQRQRADAGYAQLHAMGVIQRSDEPRFADYARVVASAAAADPIAACSWIGEQLKGRRLRAYRPSGRDEGSWEIQTSTKRRLVPPDSNP